MKPEDNPDVIKFDFPIREGGQGYIGLFFRYYSMLAAIMADSTTDHDYRIVMLTTLMINTVPDDDIRDNLKRLKSKTIEEKMDEFKKEKGTTNISSNDKHRIMVDCCLDIVGEISGFMDTYMGISKKLMVIIENPEKRLRDLDAEVTKEV